MVVSCCFSFERVQHISQNRPKSSAKAGFTLGPISPRNSPDQDALLAWRVDLLTLPCGEFRFWICITSQPRNLRRSLKNGQRIRSTKITFLVYVDIWGFMFKFLQTTFKSFNLNPCSHMLIYVFRYMYVRIFKHAIECYRCINSETCFACPTVTSWPVCVDSYLHILRKQFLKLSS